MGRLKNVPQKTRNELWRHANGMCQKCRRELDPSTSGHAPTAEVAHIVALSDRGPRGDPSIPVPERNAVENLLLLCPTCHDLIDKDNGSLYDLAALISLKAEHEAWTESLRLAGQRWRTTFLTADYVNIPRVAMLAGGEALLRLAERAGLDPTKPYRGQGSAPGMFVAMLNPFFEAWRERAAPLQKMEPGDVRQGMYVTFDADMRSRNAPSLPWRGLVGNWRRDPYLTFGINGHKVAVRYDPLWLTTNTAVADLTEAERSPTRYAGFGQVVNTADEVLHVSAHTFGKPMTEAAAAFRTLISMEAPPRRRDA